jgi:SAM-dependent methyltransferase
MGLASTVVKHPSDVGKDFDGYVAAWSRERYRMEASHSARGVLFDEAKSAMIQRPGDEWGEVAPLFQAYRSVVDRYLTSDMVDVLELGAGGGRSTGVMLEVLRDRVASYHVVDVSVSFAEVLRNRIDFPLDIHIVDDIDLSFLPSNRFSLCFSQSAWSHISLYDQYRYMREVKRVLRPNAPLYVHGQFMLGFADDWTWNRFMRRVHQAETSTQGVYHEFTSYAAVAEMLVRLRYEVDCIFTNGFLARASSRIGLNAVTELEGGLSIPYCATLAEFLNDGPTQRHVMPGDPLSPGDRSASSLAYPDPSRAQVEPGTSASDGSWADWAGRGAQRVAAAARRGRRTIRELMK